MRANKVKQTRLRRRKIGIRKRITGLPERPRLTVYRSLKHIYAQVVDDLGGRTLVHASSVQLHSTQGGNKAGAAEVGKALAQRAVEAGILAVAFDRNGVRYHGRIKALADAARKGGLKF
jgi:large subunit ribosomal protein L18